MDYCGDYERVKRFIWKEPGTNKYWLGDDSLERSKCLLNIGDILAYFHELDNGVEVLVAAQALIIDWVTEATRKGATNTVTEEDIAKELKVVGYFVNVLRGAICTDEATITAYDEEVKGIPPFGGEKATRQAQTTKALINGRDGEVV